VAAFGPGEIIRDLRDSVTEEIDAGCAEAVESAAETGDDSVAEDPTRYKGQRWIRQRRVSRSVDVLPHKYGSLRREHC